MRRALSCGVLAVVAVPVLSLPALALAAESQRSLAVDASAWSWRKVTPAGLPGGEPSNVPADGLAVQFDGRPDVAPAKATYLRLALGDLPSGTTALGLTLVLPMDDGQSEPGPLVACALPTPFVVGAGVDPAKQPAEDCADAPVGTYDPVAESIAFDLTAQANAWLSGSPNNGVVVRPDPTVAFPEALPYQVTFTGATTVTGLLVAALPDVVVAPPATSPKAPVAQPGPVVAPIPGFASAPVTESFTPPMPAPVPAAPPAVAPAPVAAAPPVAAAVPVVHSRAAGRASQAGLAAGGLVGLVLLGAVGWALGDSADPRTFARAERRRRDRLARGPLVLSRQPRQIRQGRKPLSSAASTVT